MVASLDAIVGETVTPGAPIARIADTSAWRFESVDLDEAAVGRLDVGADATITVDALPGIEIPARVVSISSFGESSAGDIVYTVTLEPIGRPARRPALEHDLQRGDPRRALVGFPWWSWRMAIDISHEGYMM